MALQDSYNDFVQFEIIDITWDDGFSGLADRSRPTDDPRTLVGEETENIPYFDKEDLTEREKEIQNNYIDKQIANFDESVEDFNESNYSITFEYTNPSIGIDSSANFIKHDIIGGPTVRQKIGTNPLEISINGVVKEDVAQDLELLRNAKSAKLLSNRFADDSVTVHIVSITTDPIEDGGAADLTEGEFLYTFSMECVELYGSG